MSTKLLFICSGNICRSPMALEIARSESKRMGINIETNSAGTLMIEGREADPHAVAVCQEISIDLSRHLSKGVTAELVEWCDHILVMESHHSAFIAAKFPQGRDKVIFIAHLVGQVAVPDPIGTSRRAFRKNRDLIFQATRALLERLP